MWRYGYNTPANYDDNQMFCGGFYVSIIAKFITDLMEIKVKWRKEDILETTIIIIWNLIIVAKTGFPNT